MHVLSLFDGISCGQIALERAGIPVEKYYASEIDKYAIQITKNNYPDTIHIGGVTDIDFSKYTGIDLLLGGSPCTNISQANRGSGGVYGKESILFWKYVEALHIAKPKYFLFENVYGMGKEDEAIITKELGVHPILINSSKVSAQNRNRLYWTNIPDITEIEDKKILLKDIIFYDVEPVVLHNIYGGFKEKTPRVFLEKSPTIRTAKGGGHIPYFVYKGAIEKINTDETKLLFETKEEYIARVFSAVPYNAFKDKNCIRKFNPVECERLQTLPDNYTTGASDTQRYKMIGNGWTVDVIVHILRSMHEPTSNRKTEDI
jgi:DNA-cytosine methyltransferase